MSKVLISCHAKTTSFPKLGIYERRVPASVSRLLWEHFIECVLRTVLVSPVYANQFVPSKTTLTHAVHMVLSQLVLVWQLVQLMIV